ncbi:MAG TPA: cyclic nucleotide-binding domain-containing protein [Roseovarius sp.]|nr:cyclic nucleotide-binding domain-containing protein [Roseovarius sp.]
MEYFLKDQVFNAAGLAGVVLYLGSYALLQAGILRGSGYTYAILNLFASCLVLISLTVAFNLSSAIIQVSWIVISLMGIARLAWINGHVRFSAEENAMLQQVFADMPPPIARRFLNRGNWVDAAGGTILTEEGVPVANLYYLADGKAEIISGEQVICTITSGLIGEMNVLSGGEASATVRIAATSRLFVISGDTLRGLSARDPDFRILLEKGMSRDTGRKLMSANARWSAQAATN